ncbi:MAG TPA: amylo-alpha-1,6-glucosidase [Mariniphaga sp.]|nr:amylo-alpha-1,6-glucosidase [Mariniphaga sp.]
MSYLKFDKDQLINLQYSLNREIIRSNRSGSYISTTLCGCNTRKYHGLLVCPISSFGEEKHVLLSSLDVSVVQDEKEMQLGIHRYQGGIYEPNGHKYIHNIEFGSIPRITYQIGTIKITLERILNERKKQILMRFTLNTSQDEVLLRFKPFLAFRNIHHLSKANLFVNSKYQQTKNGISVKLYEGYPNLFMQFNKENEFIAVPDWYYDIEYLKELHRGYEYLEDLFVPGYFELSLQPGESVIFSAGLEVAQPKSLKQIFSREINKVIQQFNLLTALKNVAEQFIQQKKNETSIIAGFPWYDSISRYTFISLPGLALALDTEYLFENVFSTYKKYLKNGLFPDNIFSPIKTYTSADASLWFIWALQKYCDLLQDPKELWVKYSATVKEILECFREGVPQFIKCSPDGLISAEQEGTALTWMNSYSMGQPVVQRSGLPVELNALWYNAVVFVLEMCYYVDDFEFINRWKNFPEQLSTAFLKTFYREGHEHLADVVKNGSQDWSVRPNMVIAAGLKNSPLSKEQKKQILSIAKQKLLTNRGLRSLSPDHIRYKGVIAGNQDIRESALHQGAAWPWLIQFFTEAYLVVHGMAGISFLKKQLEMFEEALTEHCVGTLSEVYNGDPPHTGKGAISMAVNIAGVFYALHKVNSFKP